MGPLLGLLGEGAERGSNVVVLLLVAFCLVITALGAAVLPLAAADQRWPWDGAGVTSRGRAGMGKRGCRMNDLWVMIEEQQQQKSSSLLESGTE